MGLFADYLEANRENLQPYDFDPGMIIGHYRKTPLVEYRRIKEEIFEIENKLSDPHEQAHFKKELALKASELEKLKSRYLVAEKIILRVQNSHAFKSVLISDLLAHIISQYHSGYKEACELKRHLEVQATSAEYPVEYQVDESELERILLLDIIESAVGYLRNGTALDTSTMRKVVSDCSVVIRDLEHENYNSPPKAIVCYYLEQKIGMKRTKVLCSNCKSPLLKDLHYCLNCYERNQRE